jgi:hypothetical protein
MLKKLVCNGHSYGSSVLSKKLKKLYIEGVM